MLIYRGRLTLLMCVNCCLMIFIQSVYGIDLLTFFSDVRRFKEFKDYLPKTSLLEAKNWSDFNRNTYPLVMTNIAIENGRL